MLYARDHLEVVGVDRVQGDVLIHFSNGFAVHYSAEYLWSVRQEDGNIALPEALANGTTLFIPKATS